MDYTDTNMTGQATVYGSGYNSARYYDDIDNLNRCHVGVVLRTWYADKNYNHTHDPGEVSCQQQITITDIDVPVTVTFPADVTYSCTDDIADELPDYFGGICDQFAVNVDDQVFNVVNDACFKIRRTFTVLNWCDYRPQDPNWNGEGIWTGVQLIKVIDNDAPRLQHSGRVTVGVGADCVASGIAIGNVAMDAGACPAQELNYEFYIDLDWDGVPETRYSFLESDDYFLPPAANGDSITVNIVEHLGIGTYKFKWSVQDGCGNIRTASGELAVVDNKPPTPYCITVLHATVGGQGMPLPVRASMFDRGAIDNCTPTERIQVSFSEDVTDTLRSVDCSTRGVQFYRIYATDQAGNSDYCDAFLLAFDNGNCGFSFLANGSVSLPDHTMVPDVEVSVIGPDGSLLGSDMTGSDGLFGVADLELYADRVLEVTSNDHQYPEQVTLSDLVLLRKHVLGLQRINDDLLMMAADVTRDGKITGSDLRMIADHVLGIPLASQEMGNMLILAEDHMEGMEMDVLPYSFLDYDGSFDYAAYVVGDLDHSAAAVIRAALDDGRTVADAYTLTRQDGGSTTMEFHYEAPIEGMYIKVDRPVKASGDLLSSADQRSTDSSYGGLLLGLQVIRPGATITFDGAIDASDITIVVVDAETGTERELGAARVVTSTTVAAKADVVISPNPARDRLFFSAELSMVVVSDMQGRVVLAADTVVSSLDVSDLSSGIYVLTGKTTTGSSIQRKVMVVR